MDKEQLRQALYAASPFDLASDNDDLYRDAIDSVIDSKLYHIDASHCQKTVEGNAICGVRLDCHLHDWRAD
jgi:hypothetical protein